MIRVRSHHPSSTPRPTLTIRLEMKMEMKISTELEDGKEEVVAVEVSAVVDSVARGEVDADREEVTAATVVTEVHTAVIKESIM